MFRWLGRWFFRLFLGVAVAALAAYAVDSVAYLARGAPTSSVVVSRFMGIPLKGHKEEYDYLGSAQAPCAIALFPHSGNDPCWYLRQHPEQWENL